MRRVYVRFYLGRLPRITRFISGPRARFPHQCPLIRRHWSAIAVRNNPQIPVLNHLHSTKQNQDKLIVRLCFGTKFLSAITKKRNFQHPSLEMLFYLICVNNWVQMRPINPILAYVQANCFIASLSRVLTEIIYCSRINLQIRTANGYYWKNILKIICIDCRSIIVAIGISFLQAVPGMNESKQILIIFKLITLISYVSNCSRY